MGDPTDLDLPSGMVLTDSPLVSMGRYVDGDLVRFQRGKPEKIGGNMALSLTPLAGVVRGACTYNNLAGKELIGCGTASNLYSIPRLNYVPVDITPVGFVPGIQEPSLGRGWGVGAWNMSFWSHSNEKGLFPTDPLYWSVANFGGLLLAAPADGKLYVWDSTVTPPPKASPVTSVYSPQPPTMKGFWVTEERFVIAFGTPGPTGQAISLMRLYWSAQGDYTDWDTTHTPTELQNLLGAPSGSRQLQDGTRIMAGADIGSYVSLVWTDTALYTHTYTGDQNTFNTQKIGKKCGLMARQAFAIAGGTAYWISNNSFWMYSGGQLANIPNQDDVRDWLFARLRQSNYQSKTFAYFNEAFNEVWFWFATNDALEPDLAIVYSIQDQVWYKSMMPPRSGQVSFQSGNDAPVMFGADGLVYQHEIGTDNNGAAALARLKTGLMEIASGATNVSGLGIMPDMEHQTGAMSLTIVARDRSRGDTLETQVQTFTPTDKQVDYRLGGREMSLEFASNVVGGDFRMGKTKFEIAQAGKRR